MPKKTATAAATKPVATRSAAKKPLEQIEEVNVQLAEQEPKPQYRIKNELTPSTFVTVKNGFNGRLVFRCSRTNEKFIWEQFGDEQDIELQDLKNAKNAHKAFFENNWFLFDDPEVIHFLGVDRLYASSMDFREFDELFKKTPEEVVARIATIPDGQKQSLKYKAKQMISDGEIDSIKMITALEKCLGVELIER